MFIDHVLPSRGLRSRGAQCPNDGSVRPLRSAPPERGIFGVSNSISISSLRDENSARQRAL
jgi:hypothetical protein